MARLGAVIKSGGKQTGTIFFFHGTGDTGQGIKDWVADMHNFSFEHLKILFPTSPKLNYAPHDGDLVNVWFDREGRDINSPEDPTTLRDTCGSISEMVSDEMNRSGLTIDRVLFGGFSMGGSIALHMGYRILPRAAGVFALSSFLTDSSGVYSQVSGSSCPLFMSHGSDDDLVPIDWGRNTYDNMVSSGASGKFVEIRGDGHELSAYGLKKLHSWIKSIL